MNFTPKSQEELALDRIWPDGVYPFTVQKSEDAVSKAGNPMIALEVRIYNPTGREKVLKDWLLPDNMEKLSQFCRFAGIEDLYDSGNLTALDCENREGYVSIRTEKPKPGSQYGPKNVVHFYCPKPKDMPDAREMEPRRKKIENEMGVGEEDSIPF